MEPERLRASGHPFLAGLEEGSLRALAPLAREVRLAPGELLLGEGRPADTLFLVVRGRVALEVQVPGRGAVLIETIGPGDLVGLSWLFPPYRWTLDARASAETDAIAVDAAALRGAMGQDPALGYAVTRRLVPPLYDRLRRVRLQRLDLLGRGP